MLLHRHMTESIGPTGEAAVQKLMGQRLHGRL
jgi:hypothetical protein